MSGGRVAQVGLLGIAASPTRLTSPTFLKVHCQANRFTRMSGIGKLGAEVLALFEPDHWYLALP
jgi:hypothetical protein